MPTKGDVPAPQKVANSFERLKEAAAHLNKVSETLARVITDVEYVFKRLNLGIPAWVPIVKHEYDNGRGDFWARELGYAKVGPKWCIAVRLVEGDDGDPNDWRIEEYPFNESPRRFRVEAVQKLPELMDRLKEMAERTADDLTQETAYAQQFVAAIRQSQRDSTTARSSSDGEKPADQVAKHETQGLVRLPEVPEGLGEVVRKMHISGLDKSMARAAHSLAGVQLPELPKGMAESMEAAAKTFAGVRLPELPKGMAESMEAAAKTFAGVQFPDLPKGLTDSVKAAEAAAETLKRSGLLPPPPKPRRK